MNTSILILIGGCGVYDGSECTEVVATLVHLSRADTDAQCYAPDIKQANTINHLNGSVEPDNRDVLNESARIARGNVKPLSELTVRGYDALIFPGGFGAAKNLSDWAVNGTNATLQPDVARVIKAFHSAKIPIGACCISPTLLALALKNKSITVTVGLENSNDPKWPYAQTAAQINSLGAVHVPCDVRGVMVDPTNKLVTAPAYMYDGKPHEIFDSVGKMVQGVLMLVYDGQK
jgi:enhancing lycopene biosynthesis protein 2